MKKIVVAAVLLIIGQAAIWSQITTATDVGIQISSLPELKVSGIQSWTIPMFQGEGALTKGNNLKASARLELTPIDLQLGGDLVLTPIAFLQFGFGGRIGSGWNIKLFGGDLYGIGINTQKNDGTNKGQINGSAFEGMFWNVHANGLFQFDLAAILPGAWNHVVFQTTHEINYKGLTSAQPGDAWIFQNDFAENQNGFNYYGSFVLGYQMPIILNMVALMAEVNTYLYDTSNGDQWGDSSGRWIFSLLGNFNISPRFSAALIAQLRTVREYTDSTSDSTKRVEKPFYQTRSYSSTKFEFYRVALLMSIKLL
ncbi:hypothetical protein FACS1894172_09780 [Spirochaetia bacterium]|nr:hypothetical protein FACS1894164_08260 [Spirochaetia bacterium]GHU32699.1 hypothetical protein FACS1894172_09780 [Spirochaetia bacterium]